MTINFLYNWPPAIESIRIDLGAPNVNDVKYLFRVGIIKKADQSKVYWYGSKKWLTVKEMDKISFDVSRGDKILIDKQNIETKIEEHMGLWDTDKEWPLTASGASTTTIPYYF